ncbi:efflux RND transporter permease subunit [Domibacillus enclensis]|uniref:Hydrophobic/amphiphilic exporter-1, HAE1 family n=1 Tax=Domibacillus enclensis TaxID=1017273 RepID=A0A1N6TYW6_9BACI|nr:efflux RND transporter permease subunit [Domibacillus enclensis]OXS78391.1 MFS transporter [Domibacillus enclensis]SIQ58524.1 hydrophobic/amphiphilic exporter-1, HAE1 family [Domibacillus enclensis]
MKISKFSIDRPVFTTVVMFLVIILGIVSLMRIPLKLIPDLNPPIAVVVTTYEGAGPTEVSEKVTKPLEESLSTLPGIENISSTSQEGSNFILLEFSWSTNIDSVQNDVLQRIGQTPMPEGAGEPQFLKFDPSQFPIIQLSLQSDGEADLEQLAETLQSDLSSVEGVANVNVTGITADEVIVELDEAKMEEYGVGQSDVVQLIQANNISLPGSTVESEGKTLTTRVVSQLTTVEDIQGLSISVNPLNGEEVTVADIATVERKPLNEDTITRANDKPAVLLSILQESNANTADVSEGFQEKLDEMLSRDQYASVQADILFDQGDYIRLAIGNIANSLLVGGALAMAVLFFFLRNIKSPLIIGVAIPYSVIVTFVLMYFAGFNLNIMTLGALALGIGMLVDNAIVVIENIYRHLSMGKDPKRAAYDGAREVGGAITASTLTTVAVFLPVIFISGILGQIFKEFALTISFSLLASLVVALTVIPMMASRFLTAVPADLELKRQTSKRLMTFEKAVRWSLGHRTIVLVTALLLLAGGVFGLTKVGTQFLPPTDEGFVSVRVETENGTSLEETNKVVQAVESVLSEEKDTQVYVSLIGSTQEEASRGTGEANEAEMYVKMTEERERSIFEFVDDVKPAAEQAAKAVNETAEVSFNLQSASGTAPQTLTFSVRDTDSNRLTESIEQIQSEVETIEGVTDVQTDRDETVQEIQMTVNREEAQSAGFAPAQIAQIVNNATRGVFATQIIESETSEVKTVFVRYDEEVTANLEKLRQMLVKTPAGNFVPLESLADIAVTDGPVNIRHIEGQDAVQFTVTYGADENLGDISTAVDEKVESLNLSEETVLSYSGDQELLDNSKDDMIMAMVLAVVLIYIVMAAQYESFKYPFVIMFTVPLMVIGVALSLIVAQLPLSIPAIIGVLILVGIVVNNAIVIVDYILQRKQEGYSGTEAIVQSVKDRVRPILMTALTTILGLIPLASGIGDGTEINQPMGITVIGGLISSTFLTLFVIPVVFSLFDKETRRKKQFTEES